MIEFSTVAVISIAYMGIFFLIALWGDRRADQGRSLINSPIIYTLSLTVYCTTWTFYGSVGLASSNGVAFLPTYLGPTIAALAFPIILHKILVISKTNGITSIADLISSRYGKNAALAGIVTIVALVGATPYIALQIQAVSSSIDAITAAASATSENGGAESAFIVAAVLAFFSILFGTRKVDATAVREGMVLAVAIEGLVKLLAFLIVGLFVTYGLFDGFFDIADKAIAAGLEDHLTMSGTGLSYFDWFFLTSLSAMAVFVLPRQFQVSVIENVDENHLKTATWLFPFYLLLINIFVIPIALAGLILGTDGGDMTILHVVRLTEYPWLAITTYLGGLSAAMAMIVVSTVAISTMVSNDLVLPILIRFKLLRHTEKSDIGGFILNVRRIAILFIMAAGYLFAVGLGGKFSLVSIGLIAFVGIAQFLPALLAGLFWRDANLKGVLAGMIAGIAVWAYTSMLPAFAEAGLIDIEFIHSGPWDISQLRPYYLFDSPSMHPAVHSMLWSLSINVFLLLLISMTTKSGTLERLQAINFVDVNRQGNSSLNLWRGDIKNSELAALVQRFIGHQAFTNLLQEDAKRRGRQMGHGESADAGFIHLVEKRLASAVGAGSARAVLASLVRGEVIGPDEVMEIIDETSQVVRYSHQLEIESRALTLATEELREANKRLQQLDQMKDNFLSMVSHELRTPLTSIRSFSEILLDSPDLSEGERAKFLNIVVSESERLTRLINDVLDLSKIESGKMDWHMASYDVVKLLHQALQASEGIFSEQQVSLNVVSSHDSIFHNVDADRLMQVFVNLLSNAAKFVPTEHGEIEISINQQEHSLIFSISDNGPGIAEKYRKSVFEKFQQATDDLKGRRNGTGLGLAICREIVEYFGGSIWVEQSTSGGAAFKFSFPR